MTTRSQPQAQPRVPTRAELQALLPTMLLGERSRIALAAADDSGTSSSDAGTVGELWLYGLVGGYWRGFNAESVAEALRGMDVDRLVVRVHSPGGHASDGVAIGNLLRNHRAHVTVVVDGLAASAASVIAVAGDEVVMCPGSQMMLHDASTWMAGNAADLRRAADWIDAQSDNYAGVYAYKAGGTSAQWREVMLGDDGYGTWYTAEQAVAAGLATEVGTRTAVGSPPTAPEDDFDDEDSWARAAHDLQLLEQLVPAAARAAWQGERPTAPSTERPIERAAASTTSSTPQPPNASAVGSTPTEGGSAVAFSDEQMTNLRATLGLAETADEAAIVAAVSAVVEENVEERSATASTGTVPPGHVVIPAAKLSDLEAGAAAGAAAAKALRDREREEFLDANRTKFAPSNREAWAAEYDRNPEGTRAHFASAPDLIPATELGHSTEATEAEANVTEQPGYKNWRI